MPCVIKNNLRKVYSDTNREIFIKMPNSGRETETRALCIRINSERKYTLGNCAMVVSMPKALLQVAHVKNLI